MPENDDIKPKLQARRSIVTWVDILGYEAMLAAAEYDRAHEASLTMTNFDTERLEGFGERNTSYRATFTVSDAVIRVVDAHGHSAQGAIFYELSDMSINQLNTVLSGVVVSGGMVLGDVCLGTENHRTPMGQAVGEAYKLDEKRWEPAICVTRNIISRLMNDPSLRYNELQDEMNYTFSWLLSHEGEFFLNYLMAATQDDGELVDALEKHRAFIITNFTNENLSGRVRKKYRFLRDYHNAFINWVLSEEGSSARAAAFAFVDQDFTNNDAQQILETLRIETDTHDHTIRLWNKEKIGFVTYYADGTHAEPIMPLPS